MRLDLFLYERGLASSRTEAKSLILGGAVTVSGRVITKPAYDISSDAAEITVDTSTVRYVSRGGLKLEGALDAFSVSPMGRIALDIGASTGGFTDCLLQCGAELVIAVDSGKSQLHSSLIGNRRILSIEGYNARYMKQEDFPYVPSLAVMDVSFISATLIIPRVYEVLAEGGDFILLVKPQFELDREKIGKGGIVKSAIDRERALLRVVDFAKSVGFSFRGAITSPITGGDGNIEFLAHFRKG